MQDTRAPDLTRTMFQMLALGVLIATSVWILRPFLVAMAWASTIVVATWPLLLRAQSWLGGRRSLAVAALTVVLLGVLVVPFYVGIATIVEHAEKIGEWSNALSTLAIPPLPPWVERLPVIGPELASGWQQLVAGGSEELAPRLAPYAQMLVRWFVGLVGGAGLLLLQLLLTVIIAAILWANGETASRAADRFAHRLAGREGENAVQLAALAIRGVALGVVVTALLQSSLAALGLWMAGVPFVSVLTAVIFILCVAQIGPALILLPIAIWLYSTSGGVLATTFLVWAVFCSTFDNFLRPMLIKRGADLPLLLVFAGVVGGLVAFGVIGLFIGPVVLAVAYTLFGHWVAAGGAPDSRAPAGRSPSGEV